MPVIDSQRIKSDVNGDGDYPCGIATGQMISPYIPGLVMLRQPAMPVYIPIPDNQTPSQSLLLNVTASQIKEGVSSVP